MQKMRPLPLLTASAKVKTFVLVFPYELASNYHLPCNLPFSDSCEKKQFS